MGHVLAVVSQKGGVGKTTLAVNVAGELVTLGYDVKLIDADPQASAYTWFERGDGEGWPTVEKQTEATLHRPGQVPRQRDKYDIIIIDAPGKLDRVINSALLCADVALIPLAPSVLDKEAAQAVIDLIEDASVINESLEARFVLSKANPRTIQAREMVELLEEDYPDVPLLETQIEQRIAMMECPNHGQFICQVYPGSAAHDEIHSLTAEILELFGYSNDDSDSSDEE